MGFMRGQGRGTQDSPVQTYGRDVMRELTVEQVHSLVETGAMDRDAAVALQKEGKIKFGLRKAKDKPSLVERLHENFIETVERHCYELYALGYKPSITWHKVSK